VTTSLECRRRRSGCHRSDEQITERYIQAAQVLFPGAAARGEERMFGALSRDQEGLAK
jgi:hypothetical protein